MKNLAHTDLAHTEEPILSEKNQNKQNLTLAILRPLVGSISLYHKLEGWYRNFCLSSFSKDAFAFILIFKLAVYNMLNAALLSPAYSLLHDAKKEDMKSSEGLRALAWVKIKTEEEFPSPLPAFGLHCFSEVVRAEAEDSFSFCSALFIVVKLAQHSSYVMRLLMWHNTSGLPWPALKIF